MYSDPSNNAIYLCHVWWKHDKYETIKFSICAGNYVPHQIGLNRDVSRNIKELFWFLAELL